MSNDCRYDTYVGTFQIHAAKPEEMQRLYHSYIIINGRHLSRCYCRKFHQDENPQLLEATIFPAAISLLRRSEAFYKAATHLNGSGVGRSFINTHIRRRLILKIVPELCILNAFRMCPLLVHTNSTTVHLPSNIIGKISTIVDRHTCCNKCHHTESNDRIPNESVPLVTARAHSNYGG